MSQKNIKPTNRKPKRGRAINTAPLWLMLGGVGLVALALFAFWRPNTSPKAAIEVGGAPALKADKEQVDLGNEKLGQTAQVSFQLTNVGDQTLRFTKAPYIEVKEGC